jgi:sugar O-acyltransferase (sialic acid O-acetyltransferase NeuD family)
MYIVGAGGHGAVVADIGLACGYLIIGFLDDDPRSHGTRVLHWTVLGGRDRLPNGSCVALGIGSNAARSSLFGSLQALGCRFPVLIHPSATISPFACIGNGSVVMPHGVVNARARIGCGCILNTACSVDHDCLIDDGVHIAPGAHLAGNIHVGANTLIGVGASVHPGLTIGAGTVIGAGAVVVRDIPDDSIAFGNPARVRTR